MTLWRITDGCPREEALRAAVADAAAGAGLQLVHLRVVTGPTDQYSRLLDLALRAGAPMLWLEGDKLPTAAALADLAACARPWCCAPYLIYPHKTGLPAAVFAQREVAPDGSARWIGAGAPDCARTGLGLVRFGAEFAGRRPPRAVFGSALDAVVSDWARGIAGRCHVHWPAIAHVETQEAPMAAR